MSHISCQIAKVCLSAATNQACSSPTQQTLTKENKSPANNVSKWAIDKTIHVNDANQTGHFRDDCEMPRLSTVRARGPWPEGRPGPTLKVRVSGSEVGGPDPNKRVQGQLVLTPDLSVGPGPGPD
jgi:hypothetical protein